MSITEMIHFGKCCQTYKVLSFLPFCLASLVLIQVSNKSRRVGLAVNASAWVSRKFQCCTFYHAGVHLGGAGGISPLEIHVASINYRNSH